MLQIPVLQKHVCRKVCQLERNRSKEKCTLGVYVWFGGSGGGVCVCVRFARAPVCVCVRM